MLIVYINRYVARRVGGCCCAELSAQSDVVVFGG